MLSWTSRGIDSRMRGSSRLRLRTVRTPTSIRTRVPTTSNASNSSGTRLLEWAQSQKLSQPTYRVLEATGPDHQRDFIVEVRVAQHIARGSGVTKREAEQAAAGELLAMVTM